MPDLSICFNASILFETGPMVQTTRVLGGPRPSSSCRGQSAVTASARCPVYVASHWCKRIANLYQRGKW